MGNYGVGSSNRFRKWFKRQWFKPQTMKLVMLSFLAGIQFSVEWMLEDSTA